MRHTISQAFIYLVFWEKWEMNPHGTVIWGKNYRTLETYVMRRLRNTGVSGREIEAWIRHEFLEMIDQALRDAGGRYYLSSDNGEEVVKTRRNSHHYQVNQMSDGGKKAAVDDTFGHQDWRGVPMTKYKRDGLRMSPQRALVGVSR